jgi:hypothetical protein
MELEALESNVPVPAGGLLPANLAPVKPHTLEAAMTPNAQSQPLTRQLRIVAQVRGMHLPVLPARFPTSSLSEAQACMAVSALRQEGDLNPDLMMFKCSV